MAAVFPTQVSAAQVGTYFVGQYYHILQEQPSLVYQFYTEASTMVRVDGTAAETASGMMQIHSMILTLNFTGIEIKTAHSLNSWNGGVMVMVSGFVQRKDYDARRNFVQTFFLAPQEKGYFVLNDIFHLLDEEQIYQHPASILAQSNYESNLIASNPIAEQVPDYMLGQPRDYVDPIHTQEIQARDYVDPIHTQEIQSRDYVDPIHTQEIQARDYAAPVHAEENDTIDKYSIPEPQQQIPECDDIVDEAAPEEPIASFQSTMSVVREPPPVPAEEPIGEQPKKTYASILRLSKGQPSTSAPQAVSLNKSTPLASDWSHTSQSTAQHSALSTGVEKYNSEVAEDVTFLEDEGEEKSVYVGNLPSSINESDLEHEFKNFGRIKPDGVAIRSRKESGGYYAFVEFEEVIGVKNALKASPILISGWQIYVEERRPNSGLPRGRRGRGRGGYQGEAPRGRFGRSYGKVGGQDSSDREYSTRTRSNGVHQRVPRQERGILGNHATRNGPNPSEAAY